MARTAPKGDPPEEVIHARGGRRIALIAKTSQAGASDSWDTSARSTDTPTPHGVLFDPASRDRQFHVALNPLGPDPHPEPDPKPEPVVDDGTLAGIRGLCVADWANRLTIADQPGN